MTSSVRLAVRTSAALIVVAAVACTSSPDSTPTASARSSDAIGPGPGNTSPGATHPPSHVDPIRLHTTTPIKHVVFVIKENRSFDNLFGRFPGADGATMANDDGTMRPITTGYDQRLPHDLPHDFGAAVKSYDGAGWTGSTSASRPTSTRSRR